MKKILTAGLCAGGCAMAFAALDVSLGLNGDVRIGDGGPKLAVTIHREQWKGSAVGVKGDWTFPDSKTGTATFDVADGTAVCAAGRATLLATADRRAALSVVVESLVDQNPEALVLSLTMMADAAAGRAWSDASGRKGSFPKDFNADRMCVYSGETSSFTFEHPATGRPVTLAFPEKTHLMLQDDRKWMQTFTLRISTRGRRSFPKGDVRAFDCFISSPDGVDVSVASPVVVARGPDWIPLDYRKDVEAGSALDFSGMGLQDAPAGKHGWLRNANGHFEFEKLPGKPQRFYGVNLCFGASFPEEKDADALATRLARLGYNTVRIHHYEGWQGVIKDSKDRLTINEQWTRRLDKLLACCYEKGIYVTTDLFTTRPVYWHDIGIDRDGPVEMQVYKNLIGVHEPAFENWKTFSRNFLTHVNPYTGRRMIDEPGLPLISLINEGQLIWCWEKVRDLDPMKRAWKEWLLRRRSEDPEFAKGVSDDAGKVDNPWRNAALAAFMSDVEGDLARREREFLKSLGLKALLTSQNCGPHYPPMQMMRAARYDYVDDHFYVDHPQFLRRPWQLPSRCGNENPVMSKGLPPVNCAYTRLAEKPFTITEWNFSGPGMFRGVGGIMTGAMGALQNWDGLWRFAYSHGLEGMRDRSGFPGYFDVASDPLGQASDRASVCLFLRGDMPVLADSLALDVRNSPTCPTNNLPVSVVPSWRDAAWNVRVATTASDLPGVRTFPFDSVRDADKAPVPVMENPYVSLDREAGAFVISTERTAGGFTPKGARTAGPVSFDVGDVPATVWASSVDGKPIRSASRLLVTHLTDVQADGNVYADRGKKILLKWGAYPPVVRAGSAKVSLALDDPGACSVWALETTGRRLERIQTSVVDGRLVFAADVKGPNGARMLYEVCR